MPQVVNEHAENEEDGEEDCINISSDKDDVISISSEDDCTLSKKRGENKGDSYNDDTEDKDSGFLSSPHYISTISNSQVTAAQALGGGEQEEEAGEQEDHLEDQPPNAQYRPLSPGWCPMCLLCGISGAEGDLGQFLPALHCHLLCLKFARGIETKVTAPRDVEIVREVKRSRSLFCTFCHRKGATVSCAAADCKKNYHLHCGLAQGCLAQYDRSLTFCPSHHPKVPPTPLSPCHICKVPLTPGVRWLQCPSCFLPLHQLCLAQLRPSSCPGCGEGPQFCRAANSEGVRLKNDEEESEFASGALGAPSATISYLARELIIESSPALVSSKLSPVNRILSQHRSPRMNMINMTSPLKTPPTSPMKNMQEIVSSSPKSASQTTPTKSRPMPDPRTILANRLSEDDSASRPSSPRLPTIPEKDLGSPPTCSDFWKEYAAPDSKVVVVQNNTSSSEGPLSDIDDILMGNVSSVEKHPMARVAFSPDNPHLEKLLERLNSPPGGDVSHDEGQEGELEDKKVRKKRKKKSDKKASTSPRKQVLVKQHNNRLELEDKVEAKPKPKKFGKIQKLPLSERQIYHGRNWTPIVAGESESECQCTWVMDYTKKRLEELVDVNKGEKVLMDMWNKHVNKYLGRGLVHLDPVLKEFLAERSHTIVEMNLYRNFLSHVANLHQINLIGAETVMTVTTSLQEVMKVLAETRTVVGPALVEQRNQAVSKLEVKEVVGLESSTPDRTGRRPGSRVRPNSHLARPAGCRSPLGSPSRTAVASPGRAVMASNSSITRVASPSRVLVATPGRGSLVASPGRGGLPPSPSRPVSLGRGRRVANVCINVQRLSPSVQKSLNFDISPPELNSPYTSPPTLPKHTAKKPLTSTDVRSSDSESDSFHSTLGESELSSFLQNFPPATATELKTCETDSKPAPHLPAIFPSLLTFHVLTEEPDSDSESELYLSPCNSPTPEDQQEFDSNPATTVDYLKLQETEYERIRGLPRRSDISKVLVIYIDDSMIEKVRPLSYLRSRNRLQRLAPASGQGAIVEERRRKRGSNSNGCRSNTSTPDLEVSFPGLGEGSSSSKGQKKRKIRLDSLQKGDVDHSCLVEQLERTEQYVEEVKSDIMRQTTPTQEL